MVITITECEKLSEVNHRIHDLWLDFDLISASTDADQLALDLFMDAKPSAKKAGTLSVEAIKSIEIEDTQRIGRYDLNKIEYDPTTSRLHFLTNIPSKFSINVARLRLELSLMNT